jgi:predicted RNase H-like HicB family nuclease
MIPSKLVVRCYAERDRDGSWFAMCLTLNLYARGESFEEVRGKLDRLIRSYLTEAITVDRQYYHSLVPRRAPLFFWVKYALAWCMVKLHEARRFKLTLPLSPAV